MAGSRRARFRPALSFLVAIFCVPGGKGIAQNLLEFEGGEGRPGEVVEVQVHAQVDEPLCSFVVVFEYDSRRLEFIDYVDRSGASPAGIVWDASPPDGGYFGLLSCDASDIRLAPGERHLLGVLRFRILARATEGAAFVQPVERLDEVLMRTDFVLDPTGSPRDWIDALPDVLGGAAIEVHPPLGPRPVGDLVCEQALDRAEFRFSLSETYDAISILRNGASIASLEGTATSFSEPLPSISGALRYEVVAARGGEESIAVGCTILPVAPAPAPVEGLQCGESGLSWTNASAYDRILIFRNSDLIAELPGERESFRDEEWSEELTVYSVVGEEQGFPSPEAHCMDNGVWIMEAGDVQVPLDAERIEVPIYVTNSAPIVAFCALVDLDSEQFQVVPDRQAALAGTAGFPEPELFLMGLGGLGFPAAGVGYDALPPRDPEKHLAVGLRQHVVTFVFRPLGEFADGDRFPVRFQQGGVGVRDLNSDRVIEQNPQTLIPGEIRFGTSHPAAVRDLEAVALDADPDGTGAQAGARTRQVRLRWRNPASYDLLRIERNGAPVGEVSGGATTFLDAEVPAGVFTYKVIGVRGGETSLPAAALAVATRRARSFGASPATAA
jgi:hypothetical protein